MAPDSIQHLGVVQRKNLAAVLVGLVVEFPLCLPSLWYTTSITVALERIARPMRIRSMSTHPTLHDVTLATTSARYTLCRMEWWGTVEEPTMANSKRHATACMRACAAIPQ